MENQPELLLDDIYNSDDPTIKKYMNQKIQEGVDVERIPIYLAWKFKHFLSPRMQEILEAQHPRPDNI